MEIRCNNYCVQCDDHPKCPPECNIQNYRIRVKFERLKTSVALKYYVRQLLARYDRDFPTVCAQRPRTSFPSLWE